MSRIRGIAIWAVAVVVLAVFVGSPAQAACEPEKVATKYPGLAGKTLKVGLDPTLPPVMYRDPKDPSKIVGQDPDMIDAAMKCLGVKYELVGLDFGTLGYGIVGLFVVTWAIAYGVWKVGRVEERWS